MGRFIPRHRLKAGALALPTTRLPPRSVGRSLLGARLTVRIGVQAAFVGLPYPPRSRPLRPIGWRFRRVPLIAPSTQNARAGIAAVEGQVRRRSPTVAMTCKTLAVRAPFAKMGFIATDALTHRLA